MQKVENDLISILMEGMRVRCDAQRTYVKKKNDEK